MFRSKKKEQVYGEYPCVDYINNALRYLLKNDVPYSSNRIGAISELCYCISKADGYFYKDVAKRLTETGLCPFEIDGRTRK